jgi:hypothetical protein
LSFSIKSGPAFGVHFKLAVHLKIGSPQAIDGHIIQGFEVVQTFKNNCPNRFSSIVLLSTQRAIECFIHAEVIRRTSSGRILLQQRFLASVTGTTYTSENPDASVVRLFTKEGCTLWCDKVKDVLMDIRDDHPHSLEQVDITDPEHKDWFSKYKYDIPVLHIGEQYWIKHRINVEEAKEGLTEAQEGIFAERQGEPDAGKMERREAEREFKK